MSDETTTGPWQTAPNFPHGMTAIIDSDGRTKPYTLVAKAEKAADARLIAAAPELYHALEICLAMAQRKSLTGPLNLNGQSPYDIGIAALRKARGEQVCA
jgi:hypothetical protein